MFLSHVALEFYPSPFEKMLILMMDGVGEWSTTSVMLGEGNFIQPLKEVHFPHSLALFSAFTYFTDLKVNTSEYKLMGLSPYGEPVHADKIPRYHQLVNRFKDLTGYGLVVNTSFNVRGEPIVCTPEDAYHCFQKTAMDELYIGGFRLLKNDQSQASTIER